VVTSIELADIVGDALGITRESAQLHLKTVRADKQISFQGYGRAAAATTPLDAARLVIAAAGSTFAKDSAEVLRRFAKLKPLGSGSAAETLEKCLEKRIDDLPLEVTASPYVEYKKPGQRPWGSQRLAQAALQLFEPVGAEVSKLPRFALVRWISHGGDSQFRLFGPSGHPPLRRRQRGEQGDKEGREIYSIVELYSGPQLFQVRVVGRKALIEIGAALKGVSADYGNVYGNTR
jgi:hypothetical protein